MKNFLVRLAQRSIGQVPVVRSRVLLAAPLAGDAGTAPIANAPATPARVPSLTVGESPSPVPAAVRMVHETPAIPLPPADPVTPSPQAETRVLSTTRVISEVIERRSSSTPILPIEREGREAAPVADISRAPPHAAALIQPAAAVVVQPASPPPIALPDLTTRASMQAPIAIRADKDPPVDPAPAPQPAAIELFTPERESSDGAEPINAVAALRPADRDLPSLAGLEPKPPIASPAQARPADERIVQVRIGAIEIHAPTPPPAVT